MRELHEHLIFHVMTNAEPLEWLTFSHRSAKQKENPAAFRPSFLLAEMVAADMCASGWGANDAHMVS